MFKKKTTIDLKGKFLLTSLAAILISGCATPHVVDAVKASDSSLTCAQIEAEIRDADRFKADAQKEKGMTGTNVAAALFFWPAMIGTYSNANDAIAAADKRKEYLTGIHRQKKCDEVSAAKAAEENALSTKAAKVPSTTESRISDLKSMFDKGLITQAEYEDKRKAILATH